MKRVALFLCGILLACTVDFSGGSAYAQQYSKAVKRAYPKPVASAPFAINATASAVQAVSGEATDEEHGGPIEAVGKMMLKVLRVYSSQNSPALKAIRARSPLSDR